MNNPKHTPVEEHHMALIKGMINGTVTPDEVSAELKEEALENISPAEIPGASLVIAPVQNSTKHHPGAEKIISFAERSQPPEKE